MRRATGVFAAVVCAALDVPGLPGDAASPSASTALSAARAAYAKIDDYRLTLVVHETDGGRSEDKTYDVRFKKPSLERVDIIAGPDKGGGIVWRGGDTVKAHRGGFFSGIHLTLNIHNRLVATMRGDSIDTSTVPAMIDHFTATKGVLSEAPGPQIDGGDTTAVTLDVDDPSTNEGVTREVLFVAAATHFPLRHESYVGSELVKSASVERLETNVGLTADDFPW